MSVHICWTVIEDVRLVRSHCPNCNKRRYFVAWFQDWYGWHDTCLACGDQWADGEFIDRPFRPHWRKDNIESARNLYRNHAKAA